MRRMTNASQLHFGATDLAPSLTFSEQVLIELVGERPFAVVQPWAEQVSDVTWAEKAPQEQYRLYPVTIQEVLAARSQAGGQDVPVLGILMAEKPATLEAIDRELFKTPYLRDESLAVFRTDDTKVPPTIYWLVLCRHRDTVPFDKQGGGGGGNIGAAAAALVGTIVYPETIAIPSTAKKPSVAFNAAQTVQLNPAAVAAVTAAVVAPTVAATITPEEKKKRLVFGMVGFGALAALGTWIVLKSKKRRAA